MAYQVKDWKSFDGREVEAGQVLVPELVTKDYARSIGAVMANLRTWTTAGVRYTVMFVAVSLNMEAVSRQAFYADVNEYMDEVLGPERRGRQLVSLDALLEEGFLPAGAVPSAESAAMEGILPEELYADIRKVNPLFGEIIRLGYQGLDRKEIVDALPVRKSQGYEVYRRCRETVERWTRTE